MNFNRINNIVGWIVFAIATTVYVMTAEAGGSLWDCGEFVSSCFKLQIPHPPGAPLFVLIGRIFIILFGNDPLTAAKAVNVMSAIASSFTILFLFWTITHFSRRIVQKESKELSSNNIFLIMSAGVVGALAYTFSDSFWYSAVEGEVYALSSFFTALVFWMMLKWEHEADQPGADRWIVLIFFMMGLSIGVHLLNLLTIPAIVMIYYFRKYKVTPWGTFWAFAIGAVLTGFVMKFVIQYTIKGAGIFDRWFVNGLNMPFFSGFIVYFLLFAAAIAIGIRIVKKETVGFIPFALWLAAFVFLFAFPFIHSIGRFAAFVIGMGGVIYLAKEYRHRMGNFLYLGLWCFAFMLIGYSTYLTTMIRSSANPSVDMYNVDNPESLVGYLGREQYGDFPLLRGQVFTARPTAYDKGEATFAKAADKYIQTGYKPVPVYDPADLMWFPRVWDASNDQGHADFYKGWLGLEDGEAPSFAHNVNWALTYQIGWMYLRYLGWNFVGKQNDLQGLGSVRDGNTITGISFIDNIFLGDQSKMPGSIAKNKANNKLFALPLILGLLGLFYHYKRHGNDWFVTFLLFIMTGLAIVFYLNQAGPQPRERDYAFVGSFYAFAIWIGLGVMQVKEWLGKVVSSSVAGYAAAAITLLAVPVLMGFQEWDDHDRSKKQLARDLAKDYLESCEPNAILFSFGDNDTYPLWYAQEVEGIRRDVRVINYSLLGIDWYINQMRYKVNESAPIDVIWGPEKIEGQKRDVVYFQERPGVDQNRYYDLMDLMKNVIGSDDPANMAAANEEEMVNIFPVKKVSIPVDVNLVRSNKTVNANDSVLSELRFELPRNILMKNDLAVLNVIAANNWKRPIYFTSPFGELGFSQYLRADGLSYRLVPVLDSRVNNERVSDVMMNKYAFGNADKPGVYYDEENRRHLLTIRSAYATAAESLADAGDKEKAKALLQKCDKGLSADNFDYGMVSRDNRHNYVSVLFAQAAYKAGDKQLAEKVGKSVKKDLDEQIRYYASLGGMTDQELLQNLFDYLNQKSDNLNNRQKGLLIDIRQAYGLKDMLDTMEKQYAAVPAAVESSPVIRNDSVK